MSARRQRRYASSTLAAARPAKSIRWLPLRHLGERPTHRRLRLSGKPAGKQARDFLQDWRGHPMVDDYAGYKALFANGPTELACLAHIRRKFFDLHAVSRQPCC